MFYFSRDAAPSVFELPAYPWDVAPNPEPQSKSHPVATTSYAWSKGSKPAADESTTVSTSIVSSVIFPNTTRSFPTSPSSQKTSSCPQAPAEFTVDVRNPVWKTTKVELTFQSSTACHSTLCRQTPLTPIFHQFSIHTTNYTGKVTSATYLLLRTLSHRNPHLSSQCVELTVPNRRDLQMQVLSCLENSELALMRRTVHSGSMQILSG